MIKTAARLTPQRTVRLRFLNPTPLSSCLTLSFFTSVYNLFSLNILAFYNSQEYASRTSVVTCPIVIEKISVCLLGEGMLICTTMPSVKNWWNVCTKQCLIWSINVPIYAFKKYRHMLSAIAVAVAGDYWCHISVPFNYISPVDDEYTMAQSRWTTLQWPLPVAFGTSESDARLIELHHMFGMQSKPRP